jgi:hypothetical protein
MKFARNGSQVTDDGIGSEKIIVHFVSDSIFTSVSRRNTVPRSERKPFCRRST